MSGAPESAGGWRPIGSEHLGFAETRAAYEEAVDMIQHLIAAGDRCRSAWMDWAELSGADAPNEERNARFFKCMQTGSAWGELARDCWAIWGTKRASQFDGSRYPNPCGVLLGQQTGPGAGLFISCQNERPCPDHPHSPTEAVMETAEDRARP